MSFSFGAPSSAPASSGLTGFSFGANKPATPGFGLTATSQPSTGLFGSTPATSTPSFGGGAFGSTTPAFGAVSTTPAFGAAQAPAFGAASTPAFGAASTPAFGATATPAFGATTTPAFGATTTPAFGAAATPAFGAAQTPAFGATTTPAFGATATPAFGATTTPAFGATTTPAFGATTTPGFGATTTPAFGATTNPAFGATSAAPAFGITPAFGATTTPAFGASAAPAFGATTAPTFGTAGLGTGLNFGTGTGTSTASTGLSFGATTTTSAGLGGLSSFSFGGATSAQSTGFAPFGAPGASTTTTSLFGNKIGTTSVTGTQLSTSAAPSLGLGGLAPTSGVTGGTADSKSEPPKQMKLPNEISTTVQSFKEFVKKQKAMSSEVMRISVKPLHKVSRDAEAMLRQAVTASGAVGRARAQSRRLRACAAAALAAADAVNRDAALPGSELEGSPPPPYVKDLIAELEQQLITFRRQMDVADKQLQSAPKLLTEQELTLGIRRMYESLVALAGRLQAVHSQVEGQKEQYLNLRKYILKDPTNVFDTPHPNTSLDQILRDVDDPRKRMKSNTLDLSQSSAVLTDPRAVLGNIQQLAGPTPFSYVASSLSPFPTTDTTGPTWQPQAQPNFNTSLNISSFGTAPSTETNTFQLQKPPGKRGKQ